MTTERFIFNTWQNQSTIKHAVKDGEFYETRCGQWFMDEEGGDMKPWWATAPREFQAVRLCGNCFRRSRRDLRTWVISIPVVYRVPTQAMSRKEAIALAKQYVEKACAETPVWANITEAYIESRPSLEGEEDTDAEIAALLGTKTAQKSGGQAR